MNFSGPWVSSSEGLYIQNVQIEIYILWACTYTLALQKSFYQQAVHISEVKTIVLQTICTNKVAVGETTIIIWKVLSTKLGNPPAMIT